MTITKNSLIMMIFFLTTKHCLADKRLGEITGAIISIKDGMECTEAEIEEFCLDLPRYKRPKKIIFAEVPRNATGKIEKPALRKKYGVENLVAQENMG